MNDHPAVGFKIDRVREGYFIPVLVDDSGFELIRFSACACADQAAACATRGGSRPLPFLGMTRMRAGVREPIDDRSCDVSPRSWAWQHHGWTHGMLNRMIRVKA